MKYFSHSHSAPATRFVWQQNKPDSLNTLHDLPPLPEAEKVAVDGIKVDLKTLIVDVDIAQSRIDEIQASIKEKEALNGYRDKKVLSGDLSYNEEKWTDIRRARTSTEIRRLEREKAALEAELKTLENNKQ